MAAPLVDIGTGITIGFGTSGFTAEILDVNWPSITRETVDVTHQGTTGARIHSPTDLYDGGEFSFDLHFNPDTTPPTETPQEEITITGPSLATWVFNAHGIGYSPTTPLEGKMMCTATFKVSGEINITA